jgi:hypothetical protein
MARMSDESQFVVPPSFIALYLEPGRFKPRAPRDEIAARYELCEDLAQMLTEQALDKRWQLGVDEEAVLTRMHSGLLAPGSVLSEPEAQWVLTRLAELLEWPPLAAGP